MKPYLKINDNDNVLVALQDLHEGDKISVDETEITIKENIPFGHKIAVSDIHKGESVYKYGLPIGYAGTEIQQGQHIHTHNLKSNRG